MVYVVIAGFVWVVFFVALNASPGSPYNQRGTDSKEAAGCATAGVIVFMIWFLAKQFL